MQLLCLCGLIAGLFVSGTSGRAVNISSAWFLPQEGFPVFYRYFSDKVTWNEAEAVCGFHHADLLSVQTSTQMDAARAYLKEIDVTDNIWIGLRKESPEKTFAWTNGEKLLGDGYWTEPIPKTNEKLCAAIDPVSDFRWNSFYCRGPQVASFVCELPVPDWAKKEDGCMITSLPSLTVTLMPETGVIQLLSDCGLDGTRRIACKGGVNREEIIKRLSCDVDAFASTMFSKSTTDAVKEANTQQSPWPSGGEDSIRHETTQTLKTWETYPPLTRHRRDANASSPATPTQEDTTSNAEGETATTGSKPQVLNFPSHVFPHSPYSASERNAPSTKTPERLQSTMIPKIPTDKKPQETLQPETSPLTPEPAKAAKPPHALPDSESSNATGTRAERSQGLPVLIITGERLNDSATLRPGVPTSESPQIVLMIDDREDPAEPYLVPLGDDVILNNPSLSPVEVIDVDLVEVDNLTAKGTTISPATTTPRKAEGVHPMKLGEKRMADGRNQTTATSTTPSTPPKPSPTAPSVALTTVADAEKKEESLNDVEREGAGEGLEVPQRPNRGRLLTHSNHPSFYPYFLNRVLG